MSFRVNDTIYSSVVAVEYIPAQMNGDIEVAIRYVVAHLNKTNQVEVLKEWDKLRGSDWVALRPRGHFIITTDSVWLGDRPCLQKTIVEAFRNTTASFQGSVPINFPWAIAMEPIKWEYK